MLRGLKIALWVGALSPLAWMVTGFFRDWLGANPIEKVTHITGMTTLVLLLLTLAVTPIRRLTRWNPVIRLRRPLGLFAFFYAALHFGVWMGLDLGFDFSWVAEDIRKRPYITVGFTAFLLLLPLAITSTKGWIRRLGRRWARLHALVYVAVLLGCLHYYWLVKADVRLPLLLAGVFGALLVARLPILTGGRRRGGEGDPSRPHRAAATRTGTGEAAAVRIRAAGAGEAEPAG